MMVENENQQKAPEVYTGVYRDLTAVGSGNQSATVYVRIQP